MLFESVGARHGLHVLEIKKQADSTDMEQLLLNHRKLALGLSTIYIKKGFSIIADPRVQFGASSAVQGVTN